MLRRSHTHLDKTYGSYVRKAVKCGLQRLVCKSRIWNYRGVPMLDGAFAVARPDGVGDLLPSRPEKKNHSEPAFELLYLPYGPASGLGSSLDTTQNIPTVGSLRLIPTCTRTPSLTKTRSQSRMTRSCTTSSANWHPLAQTVYPSVQPSPSFDGLGHSLA